MKKNNDFFAGSAIAVAAILVAALSSYALVGPTQTATGAFHEDDSSTANNITDDSILLGDTLGQNDTELAATDNATERVAVGGGNMTVAINQFIPSSVEIEAGQNVTFYAPSGSSELHNVIFDSSNGSVISALELPFVLPQGVDADQLELVPPFNLGEPIVQELENGSQAIIAFNKLAFYPGVADQEGNITYLLDDEELQQQFEEAMQQGQFMPAELSANYTIDGTEQVVSSGIVLDVTAFGPPPEEGLPTDTSGENATSMMADMNATTTTEEEPPITIAPTDQNATDAGIAAEEEFPAPPFPFLNSFTVTFEEPGTYPFFCAFHPAMGGVVTVTEEGQEQQPTDTNQTLPLQ